MKRVRASRSSRRVDRFSRHAAVEALEQRLVLHGHPVSQLVSHAIVSPPSSATTSTLVVSANSAKSATTNIIPFGSSTSAVNQAPFFTKGSDLTVLEDAGSQKVSHWATGISAGATGEQKQKLTFVATTDTPKLFSSAPKLDASGTLTYTPALDANGTATVSVRLTDNGGTSNGGVDTSPIQTFKINVTPVNDRPKFTSGRDQTVSEDSGTTTVAQWAKSLVPGPASESSQTMTFVVSTDNASLFSTVPTVSPNGNLSFTPAPNASGRARVTVRLKDDGGTANRGSDTSDLHTLYITINPVNDAPTFVKGADQSVPKGSGTQTVSAWAKAISAGAANESSQKLTFIVSVDKPSLFSSQPKISSNGTLTFKPASTASGTAIVTVRLKDNGGTKSGGQDTSPPQTFSISIGSTANVAPSFTKGPNQVALEDSGLHSVTAWATGISAGPASESSQTLSFVVSNDNTALFATQPAIASNGTLSYALAADANGSATVTVNLKDSGGTANGGHDTSAAQTFTISVTPVNDAPSFLKGADQQVDASAGAVSVSGWATAILSGPSNESGQTLSFHVQATDSSLFTVQTAIAANGTLTFTPAIGTSGTTTITVQLVDNGGTANGGHDTSDTQQFNIGITSAAEGPLIDAALANDTAPGGLTNSDGITSDPKLAGSVFDPDGVASLTVAIDNGAAVPITINTDGTFVFDPALARDGSADGNHIAHFVARNQSGGTSRFNLSFTLDTVVPLAPALMLSAASGLVSSQTSSASRVTLLGTTDPGITVTLVQPAANALANSLGNFQFVSIPLSLGDNVFTAIATDAAGNTVQTPTTIRRVTATTSLDPVLLWNQTVLQALRTDASDPTRATRDMAMVQSAIYDVVNAIEGRTGFYVTMAAPTGASLEASISGAAHQVLTYLFPAQHELFDAVLATSLGNVPDGPTETASVSFGRQVGDAIIALRANDGWDKYVDDVPVNEPGQWQLTAPMYAPALDPQWATMQPWVMTSPDQFLPPGPPSLSSQEWADAFNEVKTLGAFNSTVRTADQTQIARFWADGAGTSSPPGHWNLVAQQVATASGNSIAENARLFAMLDITLADAAIVAWNAKFTDDFWRPITAIQNGSTDGNDLTVADPTWLPFLLTPNFPEYISGHSTFSGAAAEVLTAEFGDNYAFSTTSEGLVGVTRSFTSFDAAAAEAGRSRIYAGIHWEFSNEDGQTAGHALADYILKSFDTSTDTIAPRVIFDTDSGQATATNVSIVGRVLDNLSGVASLTAAVDGGAAVPVSFNTQGQFTFTTSLSLNGSADGLHTVSFVAADASGNTSAPVPITFTVDTVAPTLNIQSPTSGGSLGAGDSLTGSVGTSGSTVVALSYTFTGQPKMPIAFDAQTGNFSAPLDLAKLSPGSTTLTISTSDAAGNTKTTSLNLNLASRVTFNIDRFTPLDGAQDVGSTYRPQVFFSRPVNPSSLTSTNFYATGPSGTKLAANIVPSGDGTFAWLFFTQPMPSSSEITVHLDGSTILAAGDGVALDADGNGSAGGQFSFKFTTVSLTPLAGTSLSGKVLDVGPDLKPMTFDDIRVGPDQVMHTADDVFLLPIAGAKVSIVGLDGSAVFTDASGNFHFDTVPAGDVKLAIDGRTATNAPSGIFFPEMVMDLVLEAGLANTVMGTMGTNEEKAANRDRKEVYLPRLETSILQNVSNTAPTMITVGPDAAANLTAEQRSLLTLNVQPGSLRDQFGNPVAAGQVGISTVPPSLVREMLPAGILQHTFDITVQAPGITNFATPAPMTFPNLFGAAPGTQLNFLSFDHTTGRLVIEGTATVSADGLSVSTDPGTGITHPGWHGLTPQGSPTSPDPPAVVPKRLNQVIPILTGVTDHLAYKDDIWDMSFENGAVEQTDGSYMQVKITVDPKYGEKFLDGLRTQTINLRAGAKETISVAIKPKAVADALNLKTTNDTVIGAKYTVEVLRVDPGNVITTMIAPETHYLYRYVDAMDDDTADGFLKFNDAINDGIGATTRTRLVEYQGDPGAQPTITVPAATNDYEVGSLTAPNKPKSYLLIFDPKKFEKDIAVGPVFTTPASQVVNSPTPLVMLGSGVGKRDIYLNKSGLEDQLAAIADGYTNASKRAQDVSIQYILRPGQTAATISTRFQLNYNGHNTAPFQLDIPALALYANLIPLVGGSGFTVVGSTDTESITSGADKGSTKVTQNYRIEFGQQLGPTALKFSVALPINGTFTSSVMYDFNDSGAEISPNEIALIDTPAERTAFARSVLDQVEALYAGFTSSVTLHEDYVVGAYSVDWTTTNEAGLFGKSPDATIIFKQLADFLKRRPKLNLPQRNFELAQILSQTPPTGVEVYVESFFAESYPIWDVSLPFVTKSIAKTAAHELGHNLGMQHDATQTHISRSNEVQIVDTRGLGPDDFFWLNFAGEVTAPIQPRAGKLEVQTALRNLNAFKNKSAVDVDSTTPGVYFISFVHPVTASNPKPDFRGIDLPALILLGPGLVPQPSSAVTTVVDGDEVLGADFQIFTTTSGGVVQSTLSDIMVSGPVIPQTSIQEKVTGAGLKIATRGTWSSTETKALVSSLLKRLKYQKGNFDAVVPDDGETSADKDIFQIDGQFLTLFTNDPGTDSDFVDNSIDFGSASLANPVVKHYSLSNLGTESVTIRSVSITKGNAAFSVPAIPVTVLAAGESMDFDVTFRPSGRLDYSGTLSINSNSEDFNGEFDLTGNGQPPNLPSIALDFYNNMQGIQVGQTTSFTGLARPKLTNQGSAPLTITQIRVAAGQGSDEWFTPALPAPITLQPGESTGIAFSFRASKVGLRPGAFEVLSNDPTTPVLRVPIVATGVITHDDYHTYEGVDLGNDYVAADANLSFENNLPELRVKSDDTGNWNLFLPASTGVRIATYDPVSGLIANGSGFTRTGGTPTELNIGVFQPSVYQDSDGDGLPDDIEFAIGTNPNQADTDGDGKNDFAELDLGLNPLDDRPAAVGVVSALATVGKAKDVKLAADFRDVSRTLAFVASGDAGITVADVTDFNRPITIAQLDVPGTINNISVDADRKLLAAASAIDGVHLIDISDPAKPVLLRTIVQQGTDPVNAVELYDGLVYVGVGSKVRAFDIASGELSGEVTLSNPIVQGMSRGGTKLYVTTRDSSANQNWLQVVDITATGLTAMGTITLPVTDSVGDPFVVDNVAWIPAFNRVVTVNVANPQSLQIITGTQSLQLAVINDIKLNGNGLGIVSGSSALLGAVLVMQTPNPQTTNQVFTRFILPDSGETGKAANAAALGGGFAYVADGIAGLQLVNYIQFDVGSTPPTIALDPIAGDLEPGTLGLQLLETSTITIPARIADDVQVRSVEVLMNGKVVRKEVTYPYDLTVTLPKIADAGNQVVLQVRATDTGGNVRLSDPIVIDLKPDVTPPVLMAIDPPAGSTQPVSRRNVSLTFSEALDRSTVVPSNFVLHGPTGDVTPVSVDLRQHDTRVEILYPPLAQGDYTFTIHAAAVTDRAGNAMGATDSTSTFSVSAVTRPATIRWVNDTNVNLVWNDPTNWRDVATNAQRLPNANDDVLIDVPSDALITVGAGTFTVNSLISNERFQIVGGRLNVTDTIQVNNTFLLDGTSTLSPGTLKGTVLRGTGGQGLTVQREAMLDTATVETDINLVTTTQALAHLRVAGGLALTGTASVTGTRAEIGIIGNEIISSGTFLGAGATSSTGKIYFVPVGTATVTLGHDVLITGNATMWNEGGGFQNQVPNILNVINQGTITAAGPDFNYKFETDTESFINQGIMNTDNNATLFVFAKNWTNTATGKMTVNSAQYNTAVRGGFGGVSTASFINAGTIELNNSNASFMPSFPSANQTWSNTGTIVVNQSVLGLQGRFTSDDLVNIRNSGDVYINGRMDNTGRTFTFNNDTKSLFLSIRGEIVGGTLVMTGPTSRLEFSGSSPTLNGVTIEGDVEVGDILPLFYSTDHYQNQSNVNVINGLTLHGTMTIHGFSGSSVNFNGAQTVSGGTFILGSITGSTVGNDFTAFKGGPVVFDSSVTFRAAGRFGTVQGWVTSNANVVIDANSGLAFYGAGGLLNQANIGPFINRTAFTVGPGKTVKTGGPFTNDATITVPGGTLRVDLDYPTWTNSGTINLTGGGTLYFSNRFGLDQDIIKSADIGTVTGGFVQFDNDILVDNTNATIDVNATSTWSFLDATLVGGTVNVPNTASFGSNLNRHSTFKDVTVNGTTTLALSGPLSLVGDVDFNGPVTNGTNIGSELRFGHESRYTGIPLVIHSAQIDMGAGGGGTVSGTGTTQVPSVTFDTDVVFRGRNVLATFNQPLTNKGQIIADRTNQFASGEVFNFTVAPVTNLGSLSAVNKSILRIANLAAANTGTVAAAAGSSVQFTSAFAQAAAGTVHVDIGGTAATQFGLVAVTGAATLAGTLDVQFTSGYTPVAGNSFKVMTFASETGQFASVHVAGLASGLIVTPQYDGTDVTLVVGTAGARSAFTLQVAPSSAEDQTTAIGAAFEQLGTNNSQALALSAATQTALHFDPLIEFSADDALKSSNRDARDSLSEHLLSTEAGSNEDLSAASDEVFASIGDESLLTMV